MKVCAHAEVVTAGEYRSEFNLARVRDSFPALKSDWIFFDNAGGTQVRSRVVERLADYMRTITVQPGASYAPS